MNILISFLELLLYIAIVVWLAGVLGGASTFPHFLYR
jgi:hypothetical protein